MEKKDNDKIYLQHILDSIEAFVISKERNEVERLRNLLKANLLIFVVLDTKIKRLRDFSLTTFCVSGQVEMTFCK